MSQQQLERRASGRVAPLLAATAVSVTGDGAFAVAVPLLAASLTTDPFVLSVVSAAFLLPWLLVGLPAGAYADRWPRRRVMVTADVGRAVILAVLAVLVGSGHATVGVLAGAVVLVGVGQCFFDSASQGMIPALVGRDRAALKQVNGRFWALDTVGRQLAGPTLGSAAFTVSRVVPFAGDAVTFVVSAVLVGRLPAIPAPPAQTGVFTAIREGVRFLVGHRDLRALVGIMCVNNSAYSIASATFVLYAARVLHLPPVGYGVLLAATAVGGAGAGWAAKPLTGRLNYRTVLTFSCLTQGVAWAVIGAVPNAWLAGLMLALLGAGASLGTVALVSTRQELTPDELLGRVTSVFRLFGVGVAAGSALAGGVLATVFGLRAPLFTAAVVLAALALAIPVLGRRGVPSPES